MNRLRWFPLILLAAAAAHPESWKTTKKACDDARFFQKDFQYHNAEECGVDFFTLDPVGPSMGSITTGSAFGGGLHFVHQSDANNNFTVKGIYTYNSSFLFGGQYQFNFPPPHAIVTGKRKDGHGGQTDLTKGNLFVTGVHFDLHAQDFYGVGPNSALAGHAVYRQHETWAGLQVYSPLASAGNYLGIFGVSGQLKYLHPSTGGVNGDSLPSVAARYGEAGAPGSLIKADFIAAGVGFDLRTPTSRPRDWEHHEAQLTYTYYSEFSSSQFSFHRLEAFDSLSFDLSKSLPTPPGLDLLNPPKRSAWRNSLCMENSNGGCNIGSITSTTLLTTSYTSARSSVPFYLQPTLGGADFEGADTLRGLVDYRLRAPNRLVTQIDFDKPVANIGIKDHPIGKYGLCAFFDAGNVSFTPGQLTAQGLRKDVGIGASISIQNKIVFRAYIGFGAGEGSHFNTKAANTLALTPQTIGSWIP